MSNLNNFNNPNNRNKKTAKDRFNDFLTGRGFYIALFLCVVAIGISGYYLLRSSNMPADPSGGSSTAVVGPVDIQVDDSTQTNDGAPKAENPVTNEQKAETAEAPVQEDVKPLPVVTPTPPEVKASFVWPVSGSILMDFSDELPVFHATLGDWRVHTGIDLSAAVGTQVMAISSGKISAVYDDDMMGTTVVITHAEGLTSVYSNLAATPAVIEGDSVGTGAVIGAVGATALAESADAPHLHLEILKDGMAVNPTAVLPAR